MTEKLFGEAQPKVKVVEGVSVDVNVSQDLSNIFEQSDFGSTHSSSDESLNTSLETFSSENEDNLSEILFHEHEELDENAKLRNDLRNVATKYRLSRSCVNDLLSSLIDYGVELPKDSRTLLKTQRTVDDIIHNPGDESSYRYFGIRNNLSLLLSENLLDLSENKLKLLVNIDGVPLSKSSNSQLWPILGAVFKSKFIFPIAIYHGTSKPSSAEVFLADFVHEVVDLMRNGIEFQRTVIVFELKAIICDAPARSFVKCIIGHTGYSACERCEVRGERKQNRTVYDSYNDDPLRKVEKFNKLEYEHHQNDLSPLAPIVDCIDDFPLDYMHMVLLGVVKRALIFILKGDRICKISRLQAIEISNRLILSRSNIPSNFNRKPRPLDELCYWKATEYRLFLIYLGPVVLKNMVSEKLYRHFLSLHVALTLLLLENIELNPDLVTYAKNLLKWFTKNAKSVYGPLFNVYNVHSIVHIADDVLKHQCSLNEISSFPFENYLQTLKKNDS